MSKEDCSATILNLLKEYELTENSLEALYDWVHSCIRVAIDYMDEPKEFTCHKRFNGCIVEYRKNSGIFNLLKPQLDASTGEVPSPTGFVYDVTLPISTYTDLNFGVEDLKMLSKDIRLDAQDFCDLSLDIACEIKQWSENIEAVFREASLEPKY